MTMMICDHEATCEIDGCEDRTQHIPSPACDVGVCQWHPDATCVPVEPQTPLVATQPRCPKCGGNGSIVLSGVNRPCPKCNGKGYIEIPVATCPECGITQTIAPKDVKQTAWESLKAKLLAMPEPEAFKEWLYQRDLKLSEAVLDRFASIDCQDREENAIHYNWREWQESETELEQFVAEWEG